MSGLGTILKAMYPDARPAWKFYEVQDDGKGPYIAVWNADVLGPPPTDADIAAFDLAGYQAQKQAESDREAKIQAVMRGLAIAIVDGKTDPAAIVADAAMAVSAVDVKVKP